MQYMNMAYQGSEMPYWDTVRWAQATSTSPRSQMFPGSRGAVGNAGRPSAWERFPILANCRSSKATSFLQTLRSPHPMFGHDRHGLIGSAEARGGSWRPQASNRGNLAVGSSAVPA